MPMRCTVCAHAKRREIDRALALGQEANRDIALRFGVTRMSLWRHRDDHLPVRLAKAQEALDVRAALDVVEQLRAINGAAIKVLHDARQTNDPGLALRAIDRIQRQVELQAKLLGELDERPQINVLVAPEWLTLRAAVLEALRPYPDARLAVAERLAALEAA